MHKTYFWQFLDRFHKFVEPIQKFVDLLIAKWLENFWIDPDPKNVSHAPNIPVGYYFNMSRGFGDPEIDSIRAQSVNFAL